MKSRINIRVFGQVQGVFFRAGVQSEAKRLDLFGWVMNHSDGSVELIAEGELSKLEQLLEWCMAGPAEASVSHCEYVWQENKNEFTTFEIR